MRRWIRPAQAGVAMVAAASFACAGPVGIAAAESGASNSNAAAAHACQTGYQYLVGSGGQTFSNVGQCVSFAAHDGTFATGVLNIPAGHTVTFSNNWFSACNSLTWGYVLNAGPPVPEATKPYGCNYYVPEPVVIGPSLTNKTVRVFLSDNTCGATFYSDGTPYNHAAASDTNPFTVSLADAGFFCETATTDRDVTVGDGNFNTTITIS